MKEKKPTAIEKRAENRAALAPFALENLKSQLPLVFPRAADLPDSPKRHYRSGHCYPGFDDLNAETLETFSAFEISVRLFDYSQLEPLLAAYIYAPSAKGRVPFHPVSMYLLSLYRREHHLSRGEALRRLRHEEEGRVLRRCTGFEDDFPSESGLRYFERQLRPALQWEITAMQVDLLYQAGLLPCEAEEEKQATLSFDGMLHQARSRMRCSSVQASCYDPAPRPCPAREKKKQGCDCTDAACAPVCQHATPRDLEARFIAYSGNNKRAKPSPNTPTDGKEQRSRRGRMVYGYYSYAGQLLDDERATYWILPAAFGPATCGDPALFPANFTRLQARFPWLKVEAVIADAGACEQTCLDAIWDAGALRMVDIAAHQSDRDPTLCLERGYDKNGYPLCPFGYVLHANGHNPKRRRTKWRCAKRCRSDPQRPLPVCDYLKEQHKHGFIVTVGRTHADGTARLAREIPYGSPAWKALYNRRNLAESRNSVLEHLGLKRLSVHGFALAYLTILQGDFLANQHTLVRLIREAAAST